MDEEIEIEDNGAVKVIKKGIQIIEDEEDICMKKMVGLKEALSTGSMNNIGTFRDHDIEMKPHSKRMILMPEEVDEVKIFERTEV